MESFGPCELVTRAPRIPLREKRSCMTFRNAGRSRVRRIRIDGCVLKDEPACDYLLINSCDEERYIELKGSDVRRAFEQIENTIIRVGVNTLERKLYIISTRCPLASTEIQQKQKYFRSRYQARLTVKNLLHEDDV